MKPRHATLILLAVSLLLQGCDSSKGQRTVRAVARSTRSWVPQGEPAMKEISPEDHHRADSLAEKFARAVAADIVRLKEQYSFLEEFGANNGAGGQIAYWHGQVWVPNPTYEQDVIDKKNNPLKKMPMPQSTIATYPPNKGIFLTIETSPHDFMPQRMVFKLIETEDFWVAMTLRGEGPLIDEFRTRLHAILRNQAARCGSAIRVYPPIGDTVYPPAGE